ncbi:hypothetical protein [Cohnella hashimotonis]|uniref:Uncharacterized protein n=1 Tax=Cohnella hashimotonis TaxID=2826895 RepID=A0ABT6TSH3_9BACL|nr:hypothetical protein [Cohnella hashimotonis]MDI4649806.1 hypothetical protein [Cohnella hashimotonis]
MIAQIVPLRIYLKLDLCGTPAGIAFDRPSIGPRTVERIVPSPQCLQICIFLCRCRPVKQDGCKSAGIFRLRPDFRLALCIYLHICRYSSRIARRQKIHVHLQAF